MMSVSRRYIFLALSAAIHLAVVVTIGYLANTNEKVYENIEVTSYVTPTLRSSVEVSPPEKQIKHEKTKSEKSIEPTEAIAVKPSDASETAATETLAQDSEITSAAVLLNKIKANRTEAARKADYSGISKVEMVIGSDGSVKKVKLINSLPYGLDDVALRVAQESKFKPAMVNNKPVASAILFKIRFESEK
ncbi:hypothetical protein CIK05_08860 [Bdellovibrio sp. qaytius]|nr:hypothetical protein CIK05_08860 [Bdellovibrio sp. qaytius]